MASKEQDKGKIGKGKKITVRGVVRDVQATPIEGVRIYSVGNEKELAVTNKKVTPAEKLRTDVCMVMPVQVAPKGDVGFKTLPAGRYAIFLYKGSYDNLQAVYDTIYGKYLPEMECTLRDEASAERYLNDPCKTAPEELLTEIYIPVE